MEDKKIHDGSFTFSFSGPVVDFNDGEVKRIPANTQLPTIGELRAVIPKHCFEASALRGFAYIARDLFLVTALAITACMLLDPVMPSVSEDPWVFAKWFIGWNLYAFWQGTALTGLWVIGHECGHGAFSSNPVLNDIVGFVLHTALLVPYFSYQFAHKIHHMRNNHMLDGDGNVPMTAKAFGIRPNGKNARIAAVAGALGSRWFSITMVFAALLFGWPLYLLTMGNANSKIIPERMWSKAVSTAGILFVVGLLVWASFEHGVWAVANFYFVPYLWTNAWVCMYGWLQHTHRDIPHYDDNAWNWIRGALGSVDRPYGTFDWFHHKLGSTHVAHHFFPKIPWYHADEATLHLRKKLGHLHNYDSRPWYKVIFHTARTCQFVDSLLGVQYYKSFHDIQKHD